MPFLQTEYKNRMEPARAGMLHGSDNDTFTGIAGWGDSELPIELPYPRAVRLQSGEGQTPLVFADTLTAANFVGITIRDITLLNTLNDPAGDVYRSGQNVGILRRGSIWILLPDGVVAGDGAFMDANTGVIQGAGGTAIPGSRWITDGGAGNYAILHLTGQRA